MDKEKIDLLKLVLDEYKHFHELFWRVLFASIVVVITLVTTPFLKIEAGSADLLKQVAFLFPVAAGLSVLASWMLGAIRARSRSAADLYNEHMETLAPTYGVYPLIYRYLAFGFVGLGISRAEACLLRTA